MGPRQGLGWFQHTPEGSSKGLWVAAAAQGWLHSCAHIRIYSTRSFVALAAATRALGVCMQDHAGASFTALDAAQVGDLAWYGI